MGDAMLRGRHARLISLVIVVVTWALAFWAVVYIRDHVHDPMPVVIEWSAAAGNFLLAVIEKTVGLVFLPFAMAVRPKIPRKVTFLSLTAFLYLLGSTTMVANPVAGWWLFGVATVLVASVVTVIMFATFVKDSERGERAHGLFKTMTGSSESPESDSETPSESDPTSPDEAPETA
ncbi:hypothetical protein [Streptomyces sp. NPDC088816]|uniref:hypothetical protein n=1 Tax=Streptomyces sp. NPDC088816 TaxID=3365906 RepID=UPI0037FD299A